MTRVLKSSLKDCRMFQRSSWQPCMKPHLVSISHSVNPGGREAELLLPVGMCWILDSQKHSVRVLLQALSISQLLQGALEMVQHSLCSQLRFQMTARGVSSCCCSWSSPGQGCSVQTLASRCWAKASAEFGFTTRSAQHGGSNDIRASLGCPLQSSGSGTA